MYVKYYVVFIRSDFNLIVSNTQGPTKPEWATKGSAKEVEAQEVEADDEQSLMFEHQTDKIDIYIHEQSNIY